MGNPVYSNVLPQGVVSVLLVDQYGNAVSPSNPLPAGDTEVLRLIHGELQAIRRALVALACDGGKAQPSDFDPSADPAPQNMM